MKYIDQTSYMEGIIVSLDECSVGIDFKGRMGFIKVPKRMVITDKNDCMEVVKTNKKGE